MWWLLPLTASATDYCVPDSFDRLGTCAASFADIPAAVAFAQDQPGDHQIFVEPGYIETTRIALRGDRTSDSLAIIGERGEEVVLTATGASTIGIVRTDANAVGRLENVVIEAPLHTRGFVLNTGDYTLDEVRFRRSDGLNTNQSAIYAASGVITLDDVEVTGWLANNVNGPGLTVTSGATATVNGGRFVDNVGDRGGVMWAAGTLSVEDALFEGNQADDLGGGAIYFGAASVAGSVTGSTFRDNHAIGRGGAIYVRGSSGLPVTGNRFCENTATSHAGAVHVYADPLTLTGNLFFANASGQSGGGVMVANVSSASVTSRANTYAGNTGNAGAAAFAASQGTLAIDEDIVLRHPSTSVWSGMSQVINSQAYDSDFGGQLFTDVVVADPLFGGLACAFEAVTPPCYAVPPVGSGLSGTNLGAVQTCGEADSDGDGLTDEVEAGLRTDPFRTDSDDDGRPDGEECGAADSGPLLVAGFEHVPSFSGVAKIDQGSLPGWSTPDPSGQIELWEDGNAGVGAAEGKVFVSLEVDGAEGIYQDFPTVPNEELVVRFAHRGVTGTDVVGVRLYEPLGQPPATTNVSSPAGSWTTHEVSYTVPAGQTTTRIEFLPVSPGSGDGNLLDAVYVGPDNDTDGDELVDCLDEDSDGDGVSDSVEHAQYTRPDLSDTDGDGLDDATDPDPLIADTDGDGLPDFFEIGMGSDPTLMDTDGDGLLDAEECPQLDDPLVNGGFEVLGIAPMYTWGGHVPEASVPGWETTGDLLEPVFAQGHSTAPDTTVAGQYLLEIDAEVRASVSQTLATTPGEVVHYRFSHHGRNGPDTIEVLAHDPAAMPIVIQTESTDDTGWVEYSGTYTVPLGQTLTRFAWRHAPGSGEDHGNFIDQVLLSPDNDPDKDGLANCIDDDSDDDGLLDVDELAAGTDPLDEDSDDDLLLDGEDTAPLEADIDGDTVHVSEGDCDDNDGDIYPGADETCDGVDNDCDTEVDADDGDLTDGVLAYPDADSDGYGDAGAVGDLVCIVPGGAVVDATDCDDTTTAVSPVAPEICDGIDNDCDGVVPLSEGDNDGDGYLGCGLDCDDTNVAISPAGSEVCNGVDDDCNGVADDGSAADTYWYPDLDSDGYGDPTQPQQACPAPPDHVTDSTDCDDSEPSVYAGAIEQCDQLDNDCNGLVDDNAPEVPWYPDTDGDGYGAGASTLSCTQPPGHVLNGIDCDDTDATVSPDADELCDAFDWDCDGEPTLGAIDTVLRWNDLDGDSYGDPDVFLDACTHPPTYVDNDGDCNDSQPAAWEGAIEVCDSVDNDCDGQVDGGDSVDATPWWPDADNDFYGAGTPIYSCTQPPLHRANADDCDDTENSTNPAALEQCDGIDNDCDLAVDEDVTYQDWYEDSDGDGFGDTDSVINDCLRPADHVPLGGDCDESDPSVNPGAVEVCGGGDDNCSGDETDAVDQLPFYPDFDLDGWGENGTVLYACAQAAGTADRVGDCNDIDGSVNPDAAEVCDGIDNNCDGIVDTGAADAELYWRDLDGDGYGGETFDAFCPGEAPMGWVTEMGDCDDSEPLAWTDAAEVCDGVDNDCDGLVDLADPDGEGGIETWPDADEDGYGDGFAVAELTCGVPAGRADNNGDCDDTEPLAWTGADEVCDGVDNDCMNGADLEDPALVDAVAMWWPDSDGDGFGDDELGLEACSPPDATYVQIEGDCDDTDPAVSPDAEEVCGDDVDNDCDGEPDLPCSRPGQKGGCTCDAERGAPGWLPGVLVFLLARRRAA